MDLGTVSTRSGILLVIDMGLLCMWSGKRPPPAADDDRFALPAETVDLAIRGPDAEAAGRLHGRQWHPLFLYDMPPDGIEWHVQRLEEICREHGLDAWLEPLPERVPHRERVDLALERGGGAGTVQFEGVPAVAVADLPRDREMPVEGVPMGTDEFPEMWRRVDVRASDHPTERVSRVGWVGVDEARLMLVDPDALEDWRHEESLDGRADVVFWGLHAEQAAASVEAPAVDSDSFGWTDLPVDRAQELAIELEDLKEREELGLAIDFRPHSHHHQALSQMWVSPTGSGTVQLEGAQSCAFFTTWGDGAFDVERHVDPAGRTSRIRVVLGDSEQLVERQRRFWEEWG